MIHICVILLKETNPNQARTIAFDQFPPEWLTIKLYPRTNDASE